VYVGETPADKDASRLTLLCQSRAGLTRLSELLTRAYQEGSSGKAVLAKAWLTPASVRDLIALSGGQAGELGRALVSTHPERAGGAECPEPAVALAAAEQVPVVATNEVCFLSRADFEPHETRVCIAQGTTLADPSRARAYSEEQYLKTGAEMAALFADLPEA